MAKKIVKKIKPISGHELVNLAIKQWQKKLHKKFNNINFLNDSVILVNGKHKHVLGIFLFDDETKGIPTSLPVKIPNGKIRNVKTDITCGLGEIKINAGMNGTIAHEDSPGYTGSACCLLNDSERNTFLLTNGHVLSDGFVQNAPMNSDNGLALYEDEKIGSWCYSNMNTEGDFALVQVEEASLDRLDTEKFNNQIYTITKSDWLKIKIKIRGNKCKLREVYVMEVVTKRLKITYKNAESITMDEVILLADKPDKTTCLPVTQSGDSGGLAYTMDNKLVGIITAGDNKFSYILPINKLLTNLNLTVL